jgi:hypothetical protein
MPNLANLVIQDREATPVSHTFTPRDITNNVGTLFESSGVPIGNNLISLSLRKTTSGRTKATVKFVFPVLQTETINGVGRPVVVRVARANLEFDFDDTSSTQERNNAIGMVQNTIALSQTMVMNVIRDLQGVY